MALEQATKQRLVGAVVLCALLAIIWPLLFSDYAEPDLEARPQIPPMPTFEKFDVSHPTEPHDIAPVDTPRLSDDDYQQIASQPVSDAAPLAPAVVEQPATNASVAPAVTAPEVSANAPLNREEPLLDNQGLPRAWAVQVASFGQKENAQRLTERLQQAGFPAFMDQLAGRERPIYRVVVGPKLDLNAARQDAERIAQGFSLQPMVVRFDR